MAMKPAHPWRAPGWLGPWAPKITRIQNMWTQPCQIPVFIWMAGFFAASPVIAFNILSPDCLDAAGERVRRGHKTTRKSVLRIADWATPLAPPNNAAGRIGFALYNMSQRIGWYMTVIDATLDWVIHGTSFAYQWSGCSDPNQGHAYVKMDNKVPLLLPATTSLIYQWDLVSQHIFRGGATGVLSPRGHSVGYGFHLQQNMNRHLPLKDCGFSVRIADQQSEYISDPLTPGPVANGKRSVMWFDTLAGGAGDPHHYVAIVTKDYGVFNVSGTMTLSGTNLEGIAKSACGSKLEGGV